LILDETIRILVELGLTHTEAKLYTAVLGLKSATARDIHRVSKVARQDVYQSLSDLQEKGLIEKTIEKPARFRFTPSSYAIDLLTQKRNEKSQELKDRAIELCKNLEKQNEDTGPQEIPQFVLLPKSETNPISKMDKITRAISNAQNDVMYSISLPVFLKYKFWSENTWKRAVKNGVKFKILIYIEDYEKPKVTLDPILQKTDLFEIKWTSRGPPYCILILIDGKEAFYRIGSDVNCPVLWSSNPYFVALSKDYFKIKWEISPMYTETPFKNTSNAHKTNICVEPIKVDKITKGT